MNRKDLQALTLARPLRDNPEPDPLAVLHLDNQLFVCIVVEWETGITNIDKKLKKVISIKNIGCCRVSLCTKCLFVSLKRAVNKKQLVV